MSGLTYAIADLHGRFDLFCDAISAIEADSPDGGTLVILGDFVDRGPGSSLIIDLLIAGPQSLNWRWIVLQGNHEDIMLQATRDGGKMRWWIGNGGGETLRSYGHEYGDSLYPLKVPDTHLDWLQALPVTHEDDHRIFVHAGIPFDQSVVETSRQMKQWMLYRDESEEFADAQYGEDQPHISGKHIVHGHHQSASHPLLKPHRTNLDSFAWRTGRLAIGVFNDAQAAPIRTFSVERKS